MHEGYVPTPEAEAVHAQVARGEITSEEAIAIFRERALELDRKLSQARSEGKTRNGILCTLRLYRPPSTISD